MQHKLPVSGAYGTPVYYADLLKRSVRNREFLDAAALGIVQLIAADSLLTSDEKIGRIKNLTAGMELMDGRPAKPAPEPDPVPDHGHAMWPFIVPEQSVDVTGARCDQVVAHAAHGIVGSFRGRCDGVPEPADPTGLAYTRADDQADDPTPVSPARVEPHYGAVVDGGDLVDETEAPAEHYEASIRTGPTGIGDSGATCACGTDVGGFDTVAEAQEQLAFHIEAAISPTGLTRAADESRGPLAGTTPVVTYFSFGYGQKDPDTFKSLIDHYVTVVAPTYEECREAMFASRFGRAWSFDYLAGTDRATEWIPSWTEHEVIVAGVDRADADQALAAALRVLDAA